MGTQISKRKTSSTRPHRQFVRRRDLTNFVAITVVFNPFRDEKRYELYRKFAQHIKDSGVTLITVECIFDLPKQNFEVTRSTNDQHLQIRAPSFFWLKENLINIAVQRLPTYVEYIAWLDADIEFDNLDWPHMTIEKLETFAFVQLFQLSFFLGPQGKNEILREDFSFVYAIQNGKRVDPLRHENCFVHPGYAWATRRDTFNEMGGLLEFALLGGGEIHFAFALFNRIHQTIPNGLHADYRRLTKIWADRVGRLSSYGYRVTFLPIHLYHYWHGDRIHRQYDKRWSILEEYQYSPLIHLEKNFHTGLIRLDTSKSKYLQDDLLRFFDNRSNSIIRISQKSSRPIISAHDVFLPTDDLLFHRHTSFSS